MPRKYTLKFLQNSLKILLLPVLFIAISCIYTFTGGYPSHLRKVYIMHVKNRSTRQDLTLTIENLFIQNLEKDGRLSITSRDKAGLIIIPVIEDIKKTPTEFTENGEITVYSITTKAIIKTLVKKDSSYFLKDTVFIGKGIYKVTDENENAGIERSINDLVNNFLSRLFEVRI